MAAVTAETLTPQHTKAARALLDWTALELAEHCSAGVATVRQFESGKPVRQASREAIYDGLTGAGIVFYNGGQPGARLMRGSK